jgi:hypothetical protein
MAEFEELRLVVNLTDNATVGLRSLNTEIEKFNTSISRHTAQGLANFSVQTRGANRDLLMFASGVRDTLRHIGEFNKGMLEAATQVGLAGRAGVGFGSVMLGIPALLAGINAALVAFSRNMIDLGNSARIAGVTIDTFKSLGDQLEHFGYSAEAAQKDLSGFFRTVREGSIAGTPEFVRMFRESGGTLVEFTKSLQRQIERGDVTGALERAVEKGRVIMARQGTRAAEAYLQNLGLSLQALDIGHLSPAEADRFKRMLEASKEFNAEWVKVKKTMEDIIFGMQIELLPLFRDMNKEIGESGETWGRTIGRKLKESLDVAKEIADWLTRPYQKMWEKLGGKGSAPQLKDLFQGKGGLTSELGDLSPPQDMAEQLGINAIPGGAGRAGGGAARFAGTGWRGLPMSENIEVRGAMEEHDKILFENTAELKRLNDFLIGGVAGGAPGGGVGLLSAGGVGTRMGGLGGGLGYGTGTIGGGMGGVPGMGAAPYGSSVGPGTGAGAGATPATGGTQWQSDAMAPAGTSTRAAGATETITTASGAKFTVGKEYAANFRGFLSDYEAAGGVVRPGSGGGLAGRGNPSYHPLGRAIDVNQVARNRILGGLPGGSAQEEALAHKWGLRAGSEFRNPDRGHFEVNSRGRARQALIEQGLAPHEADAVTSGAPGTEGASGSLAQSRAGFAQELADPATKERLFRLAAAENPQNPQAFMESLMNRAAARGQTLSRAMNDRGYYPGVSLRGKAPGGYRSGMEAALPDVLGGSNVTNYATGNASLNVGFGYGRGARDPYTYRDPRTGERYGVENRRSDINWARRMRDLADTEKTFSHQVTGTGKLSVDVKAPSGTKVNASGEGLFKKVEMNRQTQMEPASSGKPEPISAGEE